MNDISLDGAAGILPDPPILPAANHGPSLTAEQRHVLSQLVVGARAGEPVQTLGGYAGTGKTTVIGRLVAELPDFAVCAYTGKAASVLRKKGVAASTIHRLIYEARWSEQAGRFVFRLRERLPYRGIVVDESSMVGRGLFLSLRSFGLPLVFVGDHGQLEPVGSPDFNLMRDPMYRLETIHRNAGEISRFAEHLRNGGAAAEYPTSGKVELITRTDADRRGTWTAADQIICAFNKTRVRLNALVRERLRYPPSTLRAGDRVICLRNDYDYGVYNGMQGVVLGGRSEDGRALMDFETYDRVYRDLPVDPAQFNRPTMPPRGDDDEAPIPFDYAYCITCHKAQGDEFDTVLVLEQRCDKWDHRRWAYTAASRAREQLYWIVGG